MLLDRPDRDNCGSIEEDNDSIYFAFKDPYDGKTI